LGVGFGKVRFDPFCDESREVLGGIRGTLRGCEYVGMIRLGDSGGNGKEGGLLIVAPLSQLEERVWGELGAVGGGNQEVGGQVGHGRSCRDLAGCRE
jgi:hypothetical protein